MTSKEESERVQSLIFSYLGSMTDPTAVKMKDIRHYLETTMKLPEGSFKEGVYRQMLEVFASQFYTQQHSAILATSTVLVPTTTGGRVAAAGAGRGAAGSSSSTTAPTNTTTISSTAGKAGKGTRSVDKTSEVASEVSSVPPTTVSAALPAKHKKVAIPAPLTNKKAISSSMIKMAIMDGIEEHGVVSSESDEDEEEEEKSFSAPPPSSSSSSAVVGKKIRIIPPGERSNTSAPVMSSPSAPTSSSSSNKKEKAKRSSTPLITSPPNPTNYVGEIKKGKFSISESALVRKIMEDYVEERGLEFQELSPFFQDRNEQTAGTAKKNNVELWGRLAEQLPHRSRTALYQHAMRIILNEDVVRGPFTEEEKQQLENLVSS